MSWSLLGWILGVLGAPGLGSSFLGAPELDSGLIEPPGVFWGLLGWILASWGLLGWILASRGPFGRPKMLCWLAFGEHEALKRDLKRARILIPAEGKPTIHLRLYPTDNRDNALRRSP